MTLSLYEMWDAGGHWPGRLEQIEDIAKRRRQELVEDLREWDRIQVARYAELFLRRMRDEIDRHGLPMDGERRWGSLLPPGLVQRWQVSYSLAELRLRCWARIKARRHVRWMRETGR